MVVKLAATIITARPAPGRRQVGKRTPLAASSKRPQPSPRATSAIGKASQQMSNVMGVDRALRGRGRTDVSEMEKCFPS